MGFDFFCSPPDPPTLAFLKKAREMHEKNKGFSLCRTPKIPGMEKEKRTKTTRTIGKQKKQLEGQGSRRENQQNAPKTPV